MRDSIGILLLVQVILIALNGIFASAGTAEISEVRNVPTRTTHLGRGRQ